MLADCVREMRVKAKGAKKERMEGKKRKKVTLHAQ